MSEENLIPPVADDAIPMSVGRIMLDPRSQSPIVILQSEDESWALPIWIGPFEAAAIVMVLQGATFPRPLTHDLLMRFVEALEGRIEKVAIVRIEEGTFFAEIFLTTPTGKRVIDARPSDSIAVALRAGCPILVSPAICETKEGLENFLREAQAEQYKTFLENLDTETISKYKM